MHSSITKKKDSGLEDLKVRILWICDFPKSGDIFLNIDES